MLLVGVKALGEPLENHERWPKHLLTFGEVSCQRRSESLAFESKLALLRF
jgi:hypothetical protein